jgi:sulfur-oxidizing protein SoxA
MKRILVALIACCSVAGAEERRSGLLDMRPEAQAMQRDDSMNPGMLWVLDGEALWQRKPAPNAKSCADCHGDTAVSMRGVAARYPAFDQARGSAIDMAGRIMQCRETQQAGPPLARESQDLLALTSFVAHQSRGLPIAPPEDAGMRATRAFGRELYTTRFGQIDLSCVQCHDDQAGRRLAGSIIPQGHPTGYPIYRLEWQGVGSLHRRLRGCMVGVRAKPFGYGSEEFIAIEAFLMERARGMVIESPAIRP